MATINWQENESQILGIFWSMVCESLFVHRFNIVKYFRLSQIFQTFVFNMYRLFSDVMLLHLVHRIVKAFVSVRLATEIKSFVSK